MPFVPVVDLTDPEREPSDEELEALMQSVCEKVIEREARTQERFEATLAESIARAVQGGTGSVLPDHPREDVGPEAPSAVRPEGEATRTTEP